jgi:hypothetical protein
MLMIATLVGPAMTELLVLVDGAALVGAAGVCATAPAESRAATERVETIVRVIVVAIKDSLIPSGFGSHCRLDFRRRANLCRISGISG